MAVSGDSGNAAYHLLMQFGAQLDLHTIADPLSGALADALGGHAVLCTCEEDAVRALGQLVNGAAALTPPEDARAFISALRHGRPVAIAHHPGAVGLPLHVDGELIGVLLAAPTPADDRLNACEALLGAAAILLRNAYQHTRTVASLNQRLSELDILSQIDHELTEHLSLDHVLALTLDYALRYTAAHAAFVASYRAADQTLRLEAQLGYRSTPELADSVNGKACGAALRSARENRAVVIPDLREVEDGRSFLDRGCAQLAVPVRHEDRVIAVLIVESRRPGSLTPDHARFVEQLGVRAGVTFENARLFAETEAEREKLALILATIGDPVLVLNPALEIVLANQAARDALRLPPDETIVGEPVGHVLAGTTLADLAAYISNDAPLPYGEVAMPDGREYFALLSRHPAIGAILVLHDLAALKKTEALKNELLSTISHDLKQPLTVMTGYLELLQMFQKLEPRSMHYVEMLQNAVRSMRTLIDDILNLARIESGVQVDAAPVQLADLLARVMEDMQPLAQAKAIVLTGADVSAMPPVLADSALANTILSNLVGNAVKYTPPEGHVTISAECRGKFAYLSVQDTGIGIGPADQARVFDRFYRVRRAETIHIEGTGLGLAIVKRLVELHGGSVSLRSMLGEGSTFTISLPLANAAPASKRAPNAPVGP